MLNFEIGDSVIISAEHTARSHYHLGQIVDAYPGKNNTVCLFKVPNIKCQIRHLSDLSIFFAFLVNEESMLCCKNELI